MKIVSKESVKGVISTQERAGNLEFCTTVINGTEYVYFRVGRNVAERAGLKIGDKVELAWDDEEKKGRISPSPKGWALQSGNIKAENPPLVLRVTRKEADWPRLEKIAKCRNVKLAANSLEFNFPEGTVFEGKPIRGLEVQKRKAAESAPSLFEEHKAIIEGNRRRDGDARIRMRDGKPYGRRATDT